MSNDILENNSKLSTAVFVDYECWYFGLHNQYGCGTDVVNWFQDVKSRGRIDELHFFGDFNNKFLVQDMPKLRTLTNDIIDCFNPNNTKDYTDFIILDRIYQTVMKNDNIKQFILFSGDGHFSSVAAFLKNFRDKIVGIYAVDGTLSTQLRDSASWCQVISVPKTNLNYTNEIKLILENLHWTELQDGLFPTFAKTVFIVSKHSRNVSQESVTAALKQLIAEKYIEQKIKIMDGDKTIRALVPNWELLAKDGLWNPAA